MKVLKKEKKISFENFENNNDAETLEFMIDSFNAVNVSVGKNYAQN